MYEMIWIIPSQNDRDIVKCSNLTLPKTLSFLTHHHQVQRTWRIVVSEQIICTAWFSRSIEVDIGRDVPESRLPPAFFTC